MVDCILEFVSNRLDVPDKEFVEIFNHRCQSGYVKGRFIGAESIRLITDTMHFTKEKNILGIAVFLDFEKAFDSIEWNFIH